MRDYEFTAIYPIDEEKFAKAAEFVLAKFGEMGVQVLKDEDQGIKPLAYLIKKEDRGHYRYYEIQAEPSKIQEMSDAFQLSGLLLKFLFVAK